MPERVTVDGDRVLRPAAWWTPTVHALLDYLHSVGFDRVPRPLGIVDGHEILTRIAGDSGREGWFRVLPDQGLRAFARLLRDYHDAVAGFVPPDNAIWALARHAPKPGEVICHGDFGPWNVVWHDLTPVGLLDFDFAGPASPLNDVAYALEYVAPFRGDADAIRYQHHPGAPDRCKRIDTFATEYGLDRVDGLVDAVIARQQLTIEHVRSLAERGLEPQRSWVTEGYLGELAERVAWSQSHRALFT